MVSLRRKIFFYFFVLLFFVLSFYVICYAQGYRIKLTIPPSFEMFQKTGMILVKSEPGDALIYLNNEPRQSLVTRYLWSSSGYYHTPAKIKNLLPGEYNIKLEKEGYHPWEEKIKVYPSRITKLADVHLFRQGLPLKLAEEKFSPDTLSPNKKFLAAPGKGIIFNLESQTKINLDIPREEEKEVVSPVYWSPQSDRFWWNNYLIYPGEKSKTENLSSYLPENLDKIQWGERGEKIYYQTDQGFYSFDPETKENSKLYSENYSDYLLSGDYLFVLQNGDNHKLLIKNLDSEESYQSLRLPYSPGYEIKEFRNDLIHIYDREYNNLYLVEFNPPLLILRETLNNLKYYKWLNSEEIIYGNDFEIWSLNLEEKQKTLHSRISQKIKNLATHPESGNIIYYTDKEIKVIGRQKNNKISITELTQVNNISNLFLGKDNKDIYFNAQIGNQSGFYKLNIK